MLHQKKRITHFQKGQDKSTCVFQQHSFKKKGRGWGEVSRKTFPFLFFYFYLGYTAGQGPLVSNGACSKMTMKTLRKALKISVC